MINISNENGNKGLNTILMDFYDLQQYLPAGKFQCKIKKKEFGG